MRLEHEQKSGAISMDYIHSVSLADTVNLTTIQQTAVI